MDKIRKLNKGSRSLKNGEEVDQRIRIYRDIVQFIDSGCELPLQKERPTTNYPLITSSEAAGAKKTVFISFNFEELPIMKPEQSPRCRKCNCKRNTGCSPRSSSTCVRSHSPPSPPCPELQPSTEAEECLFSRYPIANLLRNVIRGQVETSERQQQESGQSDSAPVPQSRITVMNSSSCDNSSQYDTPSTESQTDGYSTYNKKSQSDESLPAERTKYTEVHTAAEKPPAEDEVPKSNSSQTGSYIRPIIVVPSNQSPLEKPQKKRDRKKHQNIKFQDQVEFEKEQPRDKLRKLDVKKHAKASSGQCCSKEDMKIIEDLTIRLGKESKRIDCLDRKVRALGKLYEDGACDCKRNQTRATEVVIVTPPNTPTCTPQASQQSTEPMERISDQCFFCRDRQLPVVKEDLNRCVLDLVGGRNPVNVVITVLLRADNIFHVNVREANSGESLGCVLADLAAIKEAVPTRLFDRIVTLFVIDVRNTLGPCPPVFGLPFEFTKSDDRQTGGEATNYNNNNDISDPNETKQNEQPSFNAVVGNTGRILMEMTGINKKHYLSDDDFEYNFQSIDVTTLSATSHSLSEELFNIKVHQKTTSSRSRSPTPSPRHRRKPILPNSSLGASTSSKSPKWSY